MNELLNKYVQSAFEIIGDGFGPKIDSVQCEISNYSGKNIATINEWAEVTAFFNHLSCSVNYGEDRDNLEKDAKYTLFEMRAILMNEQDSIHYTKMIQIVEQMMLCIHSTETMITAVDEKGNDITELYKKELKKLKKYIVNVISKSDFDYVYNRLLEHSDSRYQERYLNDIKQRLVPYILIKNAIVASYLAKLLLCYLQPLLMFYVRGYN